MTQNRSQLRKQWKKEVSAGGVVIKKDGAETLVLLITPRKKDPTDKYFTPVWTFPKGWVGDHGDEALNETALREVREEGGIEAKILDNLGESKYFFKWQGENIAKIVNWFLMEYVSGDTANHDHEVAEAKWFSLAETQKLLTYKTDKELFAKVIEKLSV